MKTEEQTKVKNGHLQTNDALSQTDTPGVEAHPLAGVIGGFADDPLWEEFMAQMERDRRELALVDEATE